MSSFKESLKMGKLTTSKCLSCKNLLWPPNDICPKCLSNDIEWIELSSNGKLLDFSESLMGNKPVIFGIVELDENIRLLGRIICDDSIEVRKGIGVKLVKCGMENNDVFYEFQPI